MWGMNVFRVRRDRQDMIRIVIVATSLQHGVHFRPMPHID